MAGTQERMIPTALDSIGRTRKSYRHPRIGAEVCLEDSCLKSRFSSTRKPTCPNPGPYVAHGSNG
jgi:hypothetical protein